MKWLHKIEWSALWTLIGVILLFSSAIFVTLIAPEFIDPSWKQASSVYQVQMYEVSDPNVYISTSSPGRWGLEYVYHLQQGFTLNAFQEGPTLRILAPEALEKYVTRIGDETLKLTTRLLVLQKPENRDLLKEYPPHIEVLELIDPEKSEIFATTETDGVMENWVDDQFIVIDSLPPYTTQKGAIYIKNPKEYKISQINYLGTRYWVSDENGEPLKNLEELQAGKLKFLSREALIKIGEEIYRIEGCWYCHTDQTRTLVQDVVLNGSAQYPAPPSSANEYIYQKVTFPGTRRIGPDLSRVGIKRPHRDWHMSHFWFPQSESKGSIMPSFKHFFDNDPSGTSRNPYGVPNWRFEAVYQYLMTKGTRITSPNQAWWLGRDPMQTIDIIEGRK